MKLKLTVFAAMTASVLSGFSAEYFTNVADVVEAVQKFGTVVPFYERIRPADYNSVDEALAALPKPCFANNKILPKASKRYYEDVWSKECPYYAAYVYNLTFSEQGEFDMDDFANTLDFVSTQYISNYAVQGYKKILTKLAAKTIKAQIRKEGKSFVSKNGVNPIQERMNILTQALDAPRMENINLACAKCGIKFTLDLDKVFEKSDEEIENLKGSVLSGKQDIGDIRTYGTLLVYLGVDGFNEFVKTYNGD